MGSEVQATDAGEPECLEAAQLRRVAEGDASAFASLYARLSASVMAVALRVTRSAPDAEEVVQETFLELWRRAGEFHRERAPVSSWLFVIARSRAVDRLRTETRRKGRETRELQRGATTLDLSRLDRRALAEALGSLPRAQLEVIERAFIDGWSHSEIAAGLGLPLGTVKTRIRTALTSLAVRLCDPPRAANG